MPTRLSISFTAPFQVELRAEPLASPPPGHVLVQTLLSAISPGTETLIYRGQFPAELPLDENIAALQGGFSYPFKYGYSAVGQVIQLGDGVADYWLGRKVFSFNPHESHFNSSVEALLPISVEISPEQAVFLPNMETALNFVLDAGPLIGERVLVFGQGIVGLLTTALLSRFPLTGLVTLDRYPLRRQASLDLGAHASLDPAAQDISHAALDALGGEADLSLELSGAPAALNLAIAMTGFAGRILIGSWYGRKRLDLDLGGRFHRSRLKLISSQVSAIAPELSGRWDKSRRFALAWQMLSLVQPARFITQRFPIQAAAQAYQMIDEHPEQTIQVVFTYP